ncbi:MAG: hypothetical protein L0K63_11220, partial [Yaniella sp.]|nr:hypothetical protein [Yaniella sp.]
MKKHKTTSLSIAVITAAMLLAVTACGQQSQQNVEAESQEQPDKNNHAVDPGDRESQEASSPQPRLGITYDGGVAIVDGSTLETLSDFEAEGFLRINPAGDGRHMFLPEGESFRLLDAGTWAEPHGDHNHYYTADPLLTGITIDGPEPGHVVAHEGNGALFFDGSGE